MLSEEEAECRICRGSEEANRPLFHPCKCSGSIKYTHEDCLVNWLSQSSTTRCELCHHPFRFEPMYQPDTPIALPADELVLGVLARARASVVTIARVSLVLTVWLFLLPLGTCWTWYALFMKSLSQFPSIVANRGVGGLVTDAFYGCVLSAGIVFVFLGVSSLREYIRHIPEDGGDANMFQEDLADMDHLELPHHEHQLNNHHHHMHGEDNRHFPHPHPRVRENEEDVAENAPVPEPLGANLRGRQAVEVPVGVDQIHRGVGQQDGQSRQSSDSDSFGEGQGDALHGRGAGASHHIASGEGSNRPGMDDNPSGVSGSSGHDGNRGPDLGHGRGLELPNQPVRRRRQRGRRTEFGGQARTAADEPPDDELVGNAAYGAAGSGDTSGVFDDIGPDLYPNFPLVDSDDDSILHEDNNDQRFGDDYEYEMAPSDGDIPAEGAPRNGLELPDGVDRAEAAGVANEVFEGLQDEQNEEGGALFGLFELDPDEVPLEEMVGLRGHLRNLFDNAGTVLVSNAIFLIIFTLIPLLVGRLALRVASLRAYPFGVASQYLAAFDSSGKAVSFSSALNLPATAPHGTGGPSVTSLKHAAAHIAASNMSDPVVSSVDNLFVVLLGYGVISLGAFGYVIVNSVLRSRYPRLDTPMTRQVFRVLRYLAIFVKIVVLIVFEFGVFPLGCGWWLDICTLRLVNSTLESRTALCREFPWTCTAGHWFLGIFYMVHVSLFVSLLREFLRPELLWFLRNPDDPDFHPFRELVEKPLSRHARRMCLSVCIYAPLIVALVHVPSQLCLKVLPAVFPFNLSDFSNSLVEIPFGNLLVVPLVSLVHHVRPGVILRYLVKLWIGVVGRALGIASLVLKPEILDGGFERNGDEQNGDQREAGQFGEIVDEEDVFAAFDEDDVNVNGNENLQQGPGVSLDEAGRGVDEESSSSQANEVSRVVGHVWARGVFMLLLGWGTLVAGVCVSLTAPTVIGRSILSVLGLATSHDFHAIGLGFYAILGGMEVSCRLFKFLSTVDTQTAVALVLPYAMVIIKAVVLLFFWFGLAPLGAGILIELVVTIPVRVAHNESPYFYLHQDWALGVLVIKVWSRIALAGGINVRWRERLERAQEGGLVGVGNNFARTFREVVWPVLWTEAIALAGPYAFCHGFIRALGASHVTASIVYRYIYLWLVCIYVLHLTLDKFKVGLHALHDSIRDDKYLVGRRLYNYSRGVDHGRRTR